jgi:hypothetical protein
LGFFSKLDLKLLEDVKYESKVKIEPNIYIPAVQVADRLWVAMLTYAGGDTSAAMPAYTA